MFRKYELLWRTDISVTSKTVSNNVSGSQYATSGTATVTLNFSSVENYAKLTSDNFRVAFSGVSGYGDSNVYAGASSASISSYNANTGVVTVRYTWSARENQTSAATIIVFCFS